jgi:hypothetical protein
MELLQSPFGTLDPPVGNGLDGLVLRGEGGGEWVGDDVGDSVDDCVGDRVGDPFAGNAMQVPEPGCFRGAALSQNKPGQHGVQLSWHAHFIGLQFVPSPLPPTLLGD